MRETSTICKDCNKELIAEDNIDTCVYCSQLTNNKSRSEIVNDLIDEELELRSSNTKRKVQSADLITEIKMTNRRSDMYCGVCRKTIMVGIYITESNALQKLKRKHINEVHKH